jgi:hypothetical protein
MSWAMEGCRVKLDLFAFCLVPMMMRACTGERRVGSNMQIVYSA